MVKVSVVGASGYSGIYLLYALSLRSDLSISFITSRSSEGLRLKDVFPSFTKTSSHLSGLNFTRYDEKEIAKNSDAVFFCLPHGESSSLVKGLLKHNKNIKIIDIGADFRFKNIKIYEEFYGKHSSPDLNDSFVYGLADVFPEKIKNAQFISNPGCYPTGALIPLLPLFHKNAVDEYSPVIIDSLSGISGAGRGLKTENLYCEMEGSAKAYNIWSHRHLPEIREKIEFFFSDGIGPRVLFTPHVIPSVRGILTTVYLKLANGISEETVSGIYESFYGKSPFVSVLDDPSKVDVKNTAFSNNCHIAFEKGKSDEEERFLKIVSAIDNLGKGASLQALQNFNLMFGLAQDSGIPPFSPYP